MVIAIPGSRLSHGSLESTSWPSAIIVPHEALGGCTPAPRYERPTSVRIAFATISVKRTSTDEAMFGSSSVNMIRSEPAPCAVAASTNSRLRSASTCPRSGLPMYGMNTNAMTKVGIQRLPAGMLMPQW